jgi:dGTPase
MSPRVRKASGILRDFLFENVYYVQAALPETERAREALRFLYDYFMRHTNELPPEYLLHSDFKWRGVIDNIAGMTDQFALKTARDLASKR